MLKQLRLLTRVCIASRIIFDTRHLMFVVSSLVWPCIKEKCIYGSIWSVFYFTFSLIIIIYVHIHIVFILSWNLQSTILLQEEVRHLCNFGRHVPSRTRISYLEKDHNGATFIFIKLDYMLVRIFVCVGKPLWLITCGAIILRVYNLCWNLVPIWIM